MVSFIHVNLIFLKKLTIFNFNQAASNGGLINEVCMKSTKNFSDKEWRCKCGCNQPHQMKPTVMHKVQILRDMYGGPLTLTSAWRCENHPAEAKKVKAGQHHKGTAVDISVSDGAMAYNLIVMAIKNLGVSGFAYGNGFIHLDWRESTPVTWRY